mmetsp:Transcript_27853/g.65000  ORF Transcript_27853/g.65000 Transcript_27853/m.65000 type:complete len:227 (+) Transcript_27853:1013-1693(+)
MLVTPSSNLQSSEWQPSFVTSSALRAIASGSRPSALCGRDTLAPAAISARAMAKWPRNVATCSAVPPRSSARSSGAPASISALHESTRFRRHASVSAVEPVSSKVSSVARALSRLCTSPSPPLALSEASMSKVRPCGPTASTSPPFRSHEPTTSTSPFIAAARTGSGSSSCSAAVPVATGRAAPLALVSASAVVTLAPLLPLHLASTSCSGAQGGGSHCDVLVTVL